MFCIQRVWNLFNEETKYWCVGLSYSDVQIDKVCRLSKREGKLKRNQQKRLYFLLTTTSLKIWNKNDLRSNYLFYQSLRKCAKKKRLEGLLFWNSTSKQFWFSYQKNHISIWLHIVISYILFKRKLCIFLRLLFQFNATPGFNNIVSASKVFEAHMNVLKGMQNRWHRNWNWTETEMYIMYILWTYKHNHSF